ERIFSAMLLLECNSLKSWMTSIPRKMQTGAGVLLQRCWILNPSCGVCHPTGSAKANCEHQQAYPASKLPRHPHKSTRSSPMAVGYGCESRTGPTEPWKKKTQRFFSIIGKSEAARLRKAELRPDPSTYNTCFAVSPLNITSCNTISSEPLV